MALRILTTPIKRLHAEMQWFPEMNADETAEVVSYCTGLKSDNQLVEPELGNINDLSRLNIKLYAFQYRDFSDFFQLKYAVLEISRLYEAIDVNVLMGEINNDRATSGFPAITDSDSLMEELKEHRGEIRKMVSSRLSELPQDEYVELVTLLAEKYSAADERYSGYAVLEDIISDYELKMTPIIEEQTHNIVDMTSFIEKGAAEIRVNDAVSDLIHLVKNWDTLAQPLQLAARGTGQKHETSESVAHAVRELAVALHNNYGNTDEAIRLTNALQQYLSELPDFSEQITEDSNTLQKLKKEKEAEGIIQGILSEIEVIKNAASRLKVSATNENVDNFISRVRKLDAQITELDIEVDLCVKLRENLCFTARDVAICLHNDKHETAFALMIASALQNQFTDVPSIKAKLAEDVRTLTQQNAIVRQREAQRKNKLIARLVIVGIIALVVVISSIGNGGHSGSNFSTNSSNSAVSTETGFSSSSTSGSKVYANIVSIWPAVGIYTEGSSNYSNFACECKTSSGATVWVYMTVTEYKNNFDSSASTSVYSSDAGEVTYTTAVKIHGTVKKADSIMSGLSSDTGTMVIDFSSLDD